MTAAPRQAADAGYHTLIFGDDFDDTSTIDMANSQTGSFHWYLAQWFNHGTVALNPADLSVSGSVLTIAASTDGRNLVSAFDNGLTPGNYYGNVFGAGGYFEARLKYDTSLATGPLAVAFYGMSIEHISDGFVFNGTDATGPAHWPGQPAHYAHFVEVDIFETLGTNNTAYQAHVHDWSGYAPSHIDIRNNDNYYTLVDLSNPDVFHTYGMLWVPQNGNIPGRIQFYCDEVLKASLYYSGPPTVPPLPGQTDGNWTPDTSAEAGETYSIIDKHRLALCLQGQAACPIHVDWVRVWRGAPTTHFRHKRV